MAIYAAFRRFNSIPRVYSLARPFPVFVFGQQLHNEDRPLLGPEWTAVGSPLPLNVVGLQDFPCHRQLTAQGFKARFLLTGDRTRPGRCKADDEADGVVRAASGFWWKVRFYDLPEK